MTRRFRIGEAACAIDGLLFLRHGRRQILWLGGNCTPDRRMGCPATRRSLRLGMDTELSTANYSPGGFAPWAFATAR
jgi:hypothetical protein